MDNHPLGSTEHRRPNPFGLEIAQDPHHCEYTADPKVVCGGDGGVTLHHSVGLFIGWLTLATSYQAKNWPADPRRPSGRWVRPVIELTE